MSKSSRVSEDDIIANQYALSFAGYAQTAQSWLRNDLGDVDVDSNPLTPEDEPFKAEPELHSDITGVGYVASPDGDKTILQSKQALATERLRKQMLGRNVRSGNDFARRGSSRGNSYSAAQRSGATRSTRAREDSDDEDEGRSGLGGKKGPVRSANIRECDPQTPSENVHSTPNRSDAGESTGRKPHKRGNTSYLDQILAERSNKKKKRKKQNEEN